MKKFLPLFAKALTLVLLATFISCGDDDKEENIPVDKIVGTWAYHGHTDVETGVFYQEDGDPCNQYNITFNANGSGNELDIDCVEGNDTEDFTWKANGNNIYTLTFAENTEDEDIDVITVTFVSDTRINITDQGSLQIDTLLKK